MTSTRRALPLLLFFILQVFFLTAQKQWAPDGKSYYDSEEDGIVKYTMPDRQSEVIIPMKELTPPGASEPLVIDDFEITDDGAQVLLYTNSQRVWRYKTRGDYWIYNIKNKSLKQLGNGRPEASLMFAKISSDGKNVAYVSERNVYVEHVPSGAIRQLTETDGTPKLINGTFDWAYEEEFSCRDGFRWSPDGKSIAYWQIDANQIRDFYMIDNTDSLYSQIIPVEYPKVGLPPSPARVGVVSIEGGETTWLDVPGDPQQHYIVRMEYAPDGKHIILQQLDRRQQVSKVMLCDPTSGAAKTIFEERDKAWVSTISEWSRDATGWDWVNGGKNFVWVSEKDGWRHLYLISRNGKEVIDLTPGRQDMLSLLEIDEKSNSVYYISTPPKRATQRYLYKTSLDGKEKPKQLSPFNMEGTHSYKVAPSGKYAQWRFSNHFTKPMVSWVSLPDHTPIKGEKDLKAEYDPNKKERENVEYFTVTTEDGVTMDGWMIKPNDFDETKKYPIIFYFYGEPAGTTVKDSWGNASNFLYSGDLAEDGYIHCSLDNRGTPSPKGRDWRKSIYAKIGQVNIRDQAMGAKKILENAWADNDRVGVWGWSGGGSSTLNCLFQYPDVFNTGVSVAPVTSSLFYDNIYTERYMGLPQDNMEDYVNGAAITHAKNLEGNLLLVHGTTDDNVHFQNAEVLVNELVKHNKQFEYFAYPGRSHGLREGEGTMLHLSTMATKFMRENCPPGPRPQGDSKP